MNRLWWVLHPFSVLLFLVIVEAGMLTFWRNAFGVYVSPILFFAVSLLISLFPLLTFRHYPLGGKIPSTVTRIDKKWFRGISLTLFVIGSIYTVFAIQPLFAEYKIYYEQSDIIPSLQVYAERFLNNEFPYQVIERFKYDIPPTYLPFMWLPYLIAEWGGFDYRWVSVFMGLSGVFCYQLFIISRSESYTGLVVKSVLPFVFIKLLIEYAPQVFGYTVEFGYTGYYMLLAFSIFSNSVFIKSSGILLPLLSRFSFVLWLPFYWAIEWFQKGRKYAFWIAGLVTGGALIFYIIPFFIPSPSVFFKGLEHYSGAALHEWWLRYVDITQEPTPNQFDKGIGFANFFVENAGEELKQMLMTFKRLHLALSVLATLLAALLYWKIKDWIDGDVYALLSLKFYLTVFYHFIQVPYIYLFLPSLFLSLFILAIVHFKMRFAWERPH